jgi:hypothetical protein
LITAKASEMYFEISGDSQWTLIRLGELGELLLTGNLEIMTTLKS